MPLIDFAPGDDVIRRFYRGRNGYESGMVNMQPATTSLANNGNELGNGTSGKIEPLGLLVC